MTRWTFQYYRTGHESVVETFVTNEWAQSFHQWEQEHKEKSGTFIVWEGTKGEPYQKIIISKYFYHETSIEKEEQQSENSYE